MGRPRVPNAEAGATLIVALIILLLASLSAAAVVNTALTQERLAAAQRERLRTLNDVELRVLAARQQIDSIVASSSTSTASATALRSQSYPIYGPSESASTWTRKIEFLGDDFPCVNEVHASKLRPAENNGLQSIRCARVRIEARHSPNPTGPQVHIEYLYEIIPVN